MVVKETWYSINKKSRKRIAAIIPVHVFGNAAWLDDLVELCQERNIKLIEDASESIGTKYIEGKFQGKYTGTIGDWDAFHLTVIKLLLPVEAV